MKGQSWRASVSTVAAASATVLGRKTLLVLLLTIFAWAPAPAQAQSEQAQSEQAPGVAAARIAAARLPEPLVPMRTPTTAAEDVALAQALAAYNQRTAPDDFRALEQFVAANPRSPWRVAVLTDLGISYLHFGYFTEALLAWEQAWQQGKDATDFRARALVDRAVGSLAQLTAHFGHQQRLEALLREIGDRPVGGSSSQQVAEARQTLWVMSKEPKHLFLCGPMALKTLLLERGDTLKQVDFLNWLHVGPKGTSLAEVAQLAQKTHLPLTAVFRKPGQPVPIPSIVHWQVGHFAAIVGEHDGRYHVEDPTFGRQGLWVTQKALDADTTGYFLTPAAAVQTVAAAAGWRMVDTQEAGRVWGAGFTQNPDPDNQGPPADPPPDPPCDCDGMAGHDISELPVMLTLGDTPVGYAPPKGPPARFHLLYSQFQAENALGQPEQPSTFNFFNVSPNWTFNWLSYVEDDPTAAGSNVSRYRPDGNATLYAGYNAGTGAFAPDEQDDSVLDLTSTSPATYKLTMRDGSVWVYGHSDGSTSFPRRVFLTQMIDPQGNALTLNYSTNGSGQALLNSVTDATGRNTTFTYGNSSFPLQITKVTDPFGRSATLSYNASGQLISDTDVLGIVSSYSYDGSGHVISLTTPYGTTNFAYAINGDTRFLQITDPLGYNEREESLQPAPVPNSDPSVPQGMATANEYLIYRDSFHWDQHEYVAAGCTTSGGCNYKDARVTHFNHDAANGNIEWHTIESQKQPLENRVWYDYPGQSAPLYSGTYDQPTAIGRVLDDGSTQLTKFAYNAQGNPTQFVDPAGRQTTYGYAANGIDVTSMSQLTPSGSQVIASFTYNSRHRPLTYTDAAGKTWTYTYNGAGQMISATDPLSEKTAYNYDSAGDLTSVVNANGQTQATFTYDGDDRVATYTDSQGWTIAFTYDTADRVTKETFPDGTTRQFGYSKLDLVSYTDRQGREWKYAYDADERLTSVTDPLSHVTKLAYYEDNALKSVTDPDGHVTTFDIDLESRRIGKVYPDGSRVSVAYQNAISRVAAVTDALKQIKGYTYTPDNLVSGITYNNAVHATPNVTFSYDPSFPRPVSMTDGTGTTQLQYVPIGQPGALKLQKDTSRLANSAITYAYDGLGRVTSRTVGGVPTSETFQYDNLGRLTRDADMLGSFAFGYLGQTTQLTSQALAGTQVATTLAYLPNSGDHRLASVDNRAGRQYRYTTSAEDLLTGAAETVNSWPSGPSQAGQSWSYAYDNDNRVLSGASTAEGSFSYAYDAASNITTADRPSSNNTGTYNSDNEIASFGGRTFTYDADGELVSDGVRTYQWDAENRLVGINYVGNAGMHTAFAYDGIGRRVSIAETPTGGGTATTTHYLWCGVHICQSRNASNQIVKQYYEEGEVVPASSSRLYYGRDRLGSVRDALLINPDFDTVQNYDYDPYGGATKTPATGPLADFRFDGMFYHATSGLYLTEFRAYDPVTGRWLTRDPLGERVENDLPEGRVAPLTSSSLHFGSDRLDAGRQTLIAYPDFDALQILGYDPLHLAPNTPTRQPHTDPRYTDSFYFGTTGLYPTQWLAQDPLEDRAGANLFAFAEANPVNLTDVLGLCPYPPPKPPWDPTYGWNDFWYGLWYSSVWGPGQPWGPAKG